MRFCTRLPSAVMVLPSAIVTPADHRPGRGEFVLVADTGFDSFFAVLFEGGTGSAKAPAAATAVA